MSGSRGGANSTERLQRRLIWVLAINGVCALVALSGIVGGIAFHIGWMNWLFVAALIVGFGAQIWLIVKFARDKSSLQAEVDAGKDATS